MARIRPQINPNTPIPNTNFSSPLNPYVNGPWFPFVAGSGVNLNSTGIPTIQNDVSAVLAAGSGITLNTVGGITTISSSGGSGLGTVVQVDTGTGLVGGPITTSGTISLDNTAVTPGSYTSADITIDAQGRITAAANGGGGATPATPTVRGTLYGCSTASNVSVGCEALCSLTTGNVNTAVGTSALFSVTSSNSNTAIGGFALYSNDGFSNVAVGVETLCSNTTGDGNVSIGNASLLSNLTGCCNTAVGNRALFTSTGSCNTSLGYQSGDNLTSGSNNVAIGPSVQFASSTGSCQLAIGYSATDNWLMGDSTKAIKPGAGIIDCAASTGTAGQVLMSNGSNAICWGAAGGASAATPTVSGTVLGLTDSNNAALGCNALAATTTGNFNTAMGLDAGCSNTTGSGNIYIGQGAAVAHTAGSYNVIIGSIGMCSATSVNPFNAVAVGSGALRAASGSGGSATVAIGTNAGCNVTTGACNTFLGNWAGRNVTTGCSNVAIGPNVTVADPTVSCQLAIGYFTGANWLTGDSTKAIKPGAGIIDSADSCGTTGQYLWSLGNAIRWSASSPSDVRDKEVLGPVPTALPVITQIETITYKWKDRETNETQDEVIYGFSAQQLRGVDPLLVDAEDEEHLRIHDRKIVPLLVKAVQELSAKVEALEAKLSGEG